MAIRIDRVNGQNYAENIIDPLLLFDSGSWTTASGSGTATLSTGNAFVRRSSLKIENNTPGSDYVVTNSTQSTPIDVGGSYQLSWYIKKDIALEVREGSVLIYKNAVLLDTQNFSIGDADADLDINQTWARFQSGTTYTLAKSDVITFQFKVSASATTELTTFLYIDGLMLNKAERRNTIAPFYTKPKDVLTQLFGSYNYQDSGASSVTAVTPGSWYKILNNSSGGLTTTAGGFSGVSPYNSTSNEFVLSELELYDDVEIRFDLSVTTVSTNQTVDFRLNIASGAAILNLFSKEYDVAVTDKQETIYISANVLTELAKTSGFTLEGSSDKANAVFKTNGYYVKVNKRFI